jgi:hypothetical protein
MTKRLALTPAVGLFAGLSVVSYGAVNMLLNGVHGTQPATTNPCLASTTVSPAPTATAAARLLPRTRTAAYASARTQHPAGMPVLLAKVVHLAPVSQQSVPQTAGDVSRPAGQQTTPAPTGSQTTPALPSTQPSPSASPPVLPQPSPGQSASPGATLPQPAPASSTTSNPVTPGGTLKSPIATATPTTTPTHTPTPTPTPTTTPTTSPPPGTLCLKVQTLGSVSTVDAHSTVRYAIWVWLTSGTGGSAKITLSASPRSVSPTFSVCVPSGKPTCSVGGLNAGQHVEVQAKLRAPGSSHKHVTLTATATSAQASNSATASATVSIRARRAPSPTSSPTPNLGSGGTLPPPVGTIPGLGIQPTGDLGSAFPQVSPSPGAAGTGTAHHGHPTKTIDLSAGLPLNVRLIGGQVIGLALLAAAVTIAVARLSLRRQPQHSGEDGPGKS